MAGVATTAADVYQAAMAVTIPIQPPIDTIPLPAASPSKLPEASGISVI